MKLIKVILENFRRYKDRVEIPILNLTALIGVNEAGKSTILDALDIFFEGGVVNIDNEDASKSGDPSNVIIGCVFSDFPEELILDREAKTSLTDEFLLNSAGNLEIIKIYNCSIRRPSHKIFVNANHFIKFKDEPLITKKISELRTIIEEDGLDDKANKSSKPSMRSAIYENLENPDFIETLIPLDTDDGKLLWTSIQRYFPIYALFKSDRQSTDQDREVQNPMNITIKQVLSSLEKQLEEIEEKVFEEVQRTAQRTLDQLKLTFPDIASTLTPKIRPPKWDSIFKLDLLSDDEISLNKRGSGVRRLILLSFFQAEAQKTRSEKSEEMGNKKSVIFAIEEPETSQHPNYQILIIESLIQISNNGDQVLLTTHVPALAELIPTQSLVYIDPQIQGQSSIKQGDPEIFDIIAETLGVFPSSIPVTHSGDDFPKVAVCVEGPTDISAIKNISKVLETDGTVENKIDSKKILWLPIGGSGNLKCYVEKKYLDSLGINQVFIFDSDKLSPSHPGNTTTFSYVAQLNAKSNCTAYISKKREIENYIHPDTISRMTGGNITIGLMGDDLDFGDIGEEFQNAIIQVLQNSTYRLNPVELDGTEIPFKSKNAKKIITEYFMANMTKEEIIERFKYTDEINGEEKIEIIEWLNEIFRYV